jgi:hypothetical protein
LPVSSSNRGGHPAQDIKLIGEQGGAISEEFGEQPGGKRQNRYRKKKREMQLGQKPVGTDEIVELGPKWFAAVEMIRLAVRGHEGDFQILAG